MSFNRNFKNGRYLFRRYEGLIPWFISTSVYRVGVPIITASPGIVTGVINPPGVISTTTITTEIIIASTIAFVKLQIKNLFIV